MTTEIVYLDYDGALEYFDTDADVMETLENMPEDERECFVVEIFLDHARETACYRMGRRDWIGKAVCEDVDYAGAYEKLRKMGEVA